MSGFEEQMLARAKATEWAQAYNRNSVEATHLRRLRNGRRWIAGIALVLAVGAWTEEGHTKTKDLIEHTSAAEDTATLSNAAPEALGVLGIGFFIRSLTSSIDLRRTRSTLRANAASVKDYSQLGGLPLPDWVADELEIPRENDYPQYHDSVAAIEHPPEATM